MGREETDGSKVRRGPALGCEHQRACSGPLAPSSSPWVTSLQGRYVHAQALPTSRPCSKYLRFQIIFPVGPRPASRLCPPKGRLCHPCGHPKQGSCRIGTCGLSLDMWVGGGHHTRPLKLWGSSEGEKGRGWVCYGPGKGGSLSRSYHAQKPQEFEIQLCRRSSGGYICVKARGCPHSLLA